MTILLQIIIYNPFLKKNVFPQKSKTLTLVSFLSRFIKWMSFLLISTPNQTLKISTNLLFFDVFSKSFKAHTSNCFCVNNVSVKVTDFPSRAIRLLVPVILYSSGMITLTESQSICSIGVLLNVHWSTEKANAFFS